MGNPDQEGFALWRLLSVAALQENVFMVFIWPSPVTVYTGTAVGSVGGILVPIGRVRGARGRILLQNAGLRAS
jgi:hypothetical protein